MVSRGKVRELRLKRFRDLRRQRCRGGHEQHLRRCIVLCLAEQVGGHHRRVRALVGDHHQLARTGGHVNRRAARLACDNALRFGDPRVTGAANLVDSRDRPRAER